MSSIKVKEEEKRAVFLYMRYPYREGVIRRFSMTLALYCRIVVL